ncbi:MAG TPA: hypothetical protein PKM34_05055 [Bacteroidales bacterium]|nr:hypothetical protein [Bacteroidales bacterium]HPI87355.1 hypothetical protein [Bacteroidales bacterium]
MKKITLTSLLTIMCISLALSQNQRKSATENEADHKFSFGTTYLILANFGQEKTNTHHYEFHGSYQLTPKDRIGIKVATWKLFAPMGIQLWDPGFRDESEFFPGRLSECGIGVTYQRMLWKGLFAAVEVLPLFKIYLDEEKNKIDEGFKLYTTWHLGYHIALFKNRFYLEPQVHCNYWPVDTKAPQGFEEKESKWKNYFLFEPNLYFGINF